MRKIPQPIKDSARARYTGAIVALAFVVSGCTNTPPEQTRLDSSGVTVVTLADAILLAHPLPTVAAGARDYAYIGPVEINRMGDRDYYLWVSLTSTIDREFVGLTPTDATELVLVVDNEPMQFTIESWDTKLDAPPYVSSTPVYATLEAHTTLDQIHRIASAETIELHLIADTHADARYEFWNGDWAAWLDFPEVP